MNKIRWILRIVIVLVPLVTIGLVLFSQVIQLTEIQQHNRLVINEVMTDNLTVLKDEKGNYPDWIEIFNGSGNCVKMSDYYLSDDNGELTKWRFPEIELEGGEYVIVFCDESNGGGEQEVHANFMLNSDKETVYLSDSAGNIIDQMQLENQKCNVSYGRLYGNPDQTGFFSHSTAGYANPAEFWQQEREEEWGNVIFSHDGGIYDNEILLSLAHEDPNAVIFYTLDGSEPNITSRVYKKPISIRKEQKKNQYVTKQSVSGKEKSYETAYGVNTVDKAVVVRACVLKNGVFSKNIQTNTYFINLEYTFPVVSLTTDPDKLFDEISIRKFDTQADYAWIRTKIDIDNYMEFVIAEAYFGNADALKLGDHNYYMWKNGNDAWKWQAYDFDSCLIDGENYFQNMLEFDYEMYGEGEDKKNFSIWLFQKLWHCKEFRRDFQQKTYGMCTEFFDDETVLYAFEEHIKELSQEMEKNLLRCERDYGVMKKMLFSLRGIEAEYENYTIQDWEHTILDMKRYIKGRADTISAYLEEVMRNTE